MYIIYEEYSRDFMYLNDLASNIEIKRVVDDEMVAISHVKNEVMFQCENVTTDTSEDGWTYKEIETDDLLMVKIYYEEEWQYTIYCKRMEVK